jgi:mercuric ion transport protein
MAIKKHLSVTGHQRGPTLMAAGGILAALAASSCCILPLVLFLGASGAGTLTQLAPYQPYFIAATIGFLGYGYWLVYRSSRMACAEGEACARPLPSGFAKMGLIVAIVLVVAAVSFDFIAPLLLQP